MRHPPCSSVCCESCFVRLHTHSSGFHVTALQERSSVSSGTLRQFDLRFEYNFSQNALDSLSCVLNTTFLKSWRGAAAAKWRDCCFSANQRAPRRRDNFFFPGAMRTKRVKIDACDWGSRRRLRRREFATSLPLHHGRADREPHKGKVLATQGYRHVQVSRRNEV